MRYDRGYGREFQAGRGGGQGPMRGYDFGLRGFSDTAPQRYNREYVHPEPNQLRTNYTPFGGDFDERIVDSTGYWRPYSTQGGSNTMRGGGLPVGWEREASYARYDREYRGYGRDFYGPMR